MKKFKILSVMLILGLALFYPSARAGAAIEMSVSDAAANPGDTAVEVNISLSDTSSLSFRPWGIEVLLVYDQNLLELPAQGGILADGLAVGWVAMYDTAPQGLPQGKDGVRINLLGSGDLPSAAGRIAKILFNVKPAAPLGAISLDITSAILTNGLDSFNNLTFNSGSFAIVQPAAPVNNAPVIISRVPDVDEMTINLTTGGALSFGINAEDADGDILTYTWQLGSEILSNETGNTLNAASFVGTLEIGQSHTLKVTVDDGQAQVSAQWILHIILNNPPVATDDRAFTLAGTPVTINVLANDTDPDGDTLAVISVTQPGDPQATAEIITETGLTKVRYTPSPNFPESDSFAYSVSDGTDGTDTATVTVFAQPWDVDIDPDQPLFYPIYGTAMKDEAGRLVHLAEGDWIGVFDSRDDICYGATRYHFDQDPGINDYRYHVSVYWNAGGSTFGSPDNMKLYFKFHIAATGEELTAVAVENGQAVAKYFPQGDELTSYDNGNTKVYEGDPVRIDLVSATEQDLVLFKGWNFISFSVQPDSTAVREAFSSVLTGNNNYLEYVYGHARYWDRDIGGNLTDVDAYSSYYLKISDTCPPEGCKLTISGLRVPPTNPFTLESGWYSISYLPGAPRYAIKDRDAAFTGAFSGIKDYITWIKGATDDEGNNWCTPTENRLELGPGKGLFIKFNDTVPDPQGTEKLVFSYE
jgi:hypothetical protein